MDYQTSIRDICQSRWKMIIIKLILSALIIFVGAACKASPSPTPPPRNFNTGDLLIGPSLLPPGWKITEGPSLQSSHLLGMRKNLGGTSVLLASQDSNIEHIVAVFPSSKDAARAFTDHDFAHDTQGKYATIWKTPSSFTYDSPNADQFRVVCVDIKNKAEIGDIGEICNIEAQYEEFVSILIFRTNDATIVNSNLEILAKAIDIQIGKHIGN